MTRAQWKFAAKRFREFAEDERRDRESIAKLKEWLLEHKPKVISLDEWRNKK